MFATAAYIVSDPSAPDAFVQGIMESREWVMVDGICQGREMEKAQEIITEASSHELEATKMAVFSSFLNKVSKIKDIINKASNTNSTRRIKWL